MKSKALFAILAAITIGSCNISKDFTVENISQSQPASDESLPYYLPATELVFDIEIMKIIKNKGPYAEYAGQFLGNLQNIITQNSVSWEIGRINISTVPVRDTSQIWLINGGSPWIYLFSFTKEGFPVAYNKNVTYEINKPEDLNFSSKKKTFDYATSIDKGYKEVYDTIYKTVTFDTIQRTVPIIKKRLISKSAKEQAYELANEIFILRDDRAALLVGEGDSEYLPDGQALDIMLKGLDKLEKQYLSQFTGRTDTVIIHLRISYLPQKPFGDKEIFTLCRFSEEKGLLPVNSIEGEPVYVEISNKKTTYQLNEIYQRQNIYKELKNKKAPNGFVYRIPEPAKIKITYKNSTLKEKEVLIAQYGSNFILPGSLFKLQDLKIEFYPEYGSIKSIEY